MNISYSFKTAAEGLKINKSRSALTILGIVIGITAIIMVMSLGKGAQALILKEIQSMGSKTIAVVPGRRPNGIMDMMSTFTDSLKQKDLKLLEKKENVPHLAKIMPVVFGPGAAVFRNESYAVTVLGATNLFAEIYDLYPAQGRIFTNEEIKNYADVAIIGSEVKEKLFEENDALDKKIKIKGRNFKVIGVLGKEGQFSFFNFDSMVLVPYTTAQRYILGIKHFNRLVIEADSEKNVPQTVEDVKLTLRASHGITNPDKDDFFIETQEDAMERVSTVTSILTLFLAAVAAISLIVGGVGIMNVMLVSVTERTREIGLRKAVGATNKDILLQFLLESIMLTGIGGIIGILFGTLLSFLASLALSKFAGLNWAFIFPIQAVILGIAISALVGLIFGLYPARQAAKKSPIEALRYE